MSITLSDSAVVQVKKFLAHQNKFFGLRLGVRISGCAGMSYVLSFADSMTERDTVFEDKGIKIVIDKKNLKFLNGMKLDFIKTDFHESFKFINPNVKEQCGCGESFYIQN